MKCSGSNYSACVISYEQIDLTVAQKVLGAINSNIINSIKNFNRVVSHGYRQRQSQEKVAHFFT